MGVTIYRLIGMVFQVLTVVRVTEPGAVVHFMHKLSWPGVLKLSQSLFQLRTRDGVK